MRKIPIEKRLRQAGTTENTVPAAAWLSTGSYLRQLSKMSGDGRYAAFYEDAVEKGGCGDIADTFVAQLAYQALYSMLPGTGEEVLYQILVEPFCDRKLSKGKGGKKK